MTYTSNREVRRIKYRNEPYYIYYAPGTSFRAHDHNYVLRLLSDKLAKQYPQEFCLLPQFRSTNLYYPEIREINALDHHQLGDRRGNQEKSLTAETRKTFNSSESDQCE